MATFDYECKTCGNTLTEKRGINEESSAVCCDKKMQQVITPINVCIPPKHQACGSVIKHHGIKNPYTGV